MNKLEFNLINLTESNLSCKSAQISVGSTFTSLWGNVFKLISVDSSTHEAVVELLHFGESIEIRSMKYNDVFSLTDPSNSENKFDLILNSVFEGKEVNIANLNGCTYIQQYSSLKMIADLPVSVVDNQSYTVSGRLTKDRLNETVEIPISNEKVYINESGTKIVTATTDSDGVFNLKFTYNANNNYEIYYTGTIDVTSITKMLNATTVADATHIMLITFHETFPDYVITAFNSVSNPAENVIQILTDKGTINDLVGWQLKDIQINKKQFIVYLKKTSTLSLSNIKSFNVGDFISNILASAVIGASLGMILGAIFPPAEPFSITAGLILGILVGIFSQWDVIIRCLQNLIGCVKDDIYDESTKDKTTGEVNANAKEFLAVKLKECEDAYNLSAKDSATCITYAECIRDTYSNFQEYTQGYLFQKVATALTLNTKNLKSVIDINCINKFKAGIINCDDLITCTTNEGTASIAQGDSIIYNTYPKDSPYTAPWETPENGNGLGNMLLYGGLIIVGYIGYKLLTSKK